MDIVQKLPLFPIRPISPPCSPYLQCPPYNVHCAGAGGAIRSEPLPGHVHSGGDRDVDKPDGA